MRITLIGSDRLPVPAVKDGAIQVLMDGVKGDLAKRHKVTIYSIADPALRKTEIVEGIRYIRFPISPAP